MLKPLLLLAVVVCVTSASAQQPNIQAPPGYTTKVQSVHRSYNFYRLTRNVILPWDAMTKQLQDMPAGNSFVSALRSPSKKATNFYDNPGKSVKGFGKPKRRSYQTFQGKDGNGCVMFIEFKDVLPMDAVKKLSTYFFKTETPPNPASSKKVEQFLVNDRQVIIWSFQNPKSAVKEAHQKYIFDLVNETAIKLNK